MFEGRSGVKRPSQTPHRCRASLALALDAPLCRAGAVHWAARQGHGHPDFPMDIGDTGGSWWVGGVEMGDTGSLTGWGKTLLGEHQDQAWKSNSSQREQKAQRGAERLVY